MADHVLSTEYEEKMIIGTLAAIFVFVWFYQSAEKFNRNPLHWAIAGFLVYLIIAGAWTFLVNPGIKDSAMHTRSSILMYVARYAYIVLALGCSVFFNLKFGPKKN